jgi:hypothetical protein
VNALNCADAPVPRTPSRRSVSVISLPSRRSTGGAASDHGGPVSHVGRPRGRFACEPGEVEADPFLGLFSRAIWTRSARFIAPRAGESARSRARQRSRWTYAFQDLDAGHPASVRVSGGIRIAIPALFSNLATGTLQAMALDVDGRQKDEPEAVPGGRCRKLHLACSHSHSHWGKLAVRRGPRVEGECESAVGASWGQTSSRPFPSGNRTITLRAHGVATSGMWRRGPLLVASYECLIQRREPAAAKQI